MHIKTIKIVIFINLIFNIFLFAADDGYYDTNTIPDIPNAECYFVFDKLASPDCTELYNKYNGQISGMINDENISFYNCLISNCGLYRTDPANYKQSYQYMMEVVKKCALDKEDNLNYNELASSNWFVSLNNNMTGEVNVSTTQTQTRFIPFKVIKYKCPRYVEINYQKKQRVLQYPVLCFTNDNNSTLNNKILDCLEQKNADACQELYDNNIAGNLKNYINYVYCDEDEDGDGFPERLSAKLQAQCHRGDAANLRCQRNNLCSTSIKCVDEKNETKESFYYKNCDGLKRHYKDYTLNMQCGDVSDKYQDNPNCIRINSVTNSREEGIEFYEGDNNQTDNLNKPLRFIEIKNYPNTNDELNSYQEYIMYHKSGNNFNKRFVALIYPKAIYKKKSGYTLIGNILNILSGGLVSTIEGDSTFVDLITKKALGAGFVTKSNSIPNTVVDNILRKAIDDGDYITTNKDVKGITYKVRTRKKLIKKISKLYYMKAWWNAALIENTNLSSDPKAEDWIWSGMNRKNIHYYFKIKANPSDVLVGYTINAGDNYVSTPKVYYKQYGDVKCGNSDTPIVAQWLPFISSTKYAISSPSIENMTLFLTYPSLYLFKFYKDDQFVGSFIKNLTVNHGQYPLTNINVITGKSSSGFENSINKSYSNYRNLIINSSVDDYMQKSETLSLIDTLTDSLLNTLSKKNIDDVSKKGTKFTDYNSTLNDFYDFYATDYALDYYINNSADDKDICEEEDDRNFTSTTDNNDLALADDNNIDDFNDELLYYKKCLLSVSTQKENIDNKLNSDQNISNLEQERLNKLVELTNKVYQDLTKTERDNINDYLNKAGNRLTVTNENGTWKVSFKSKNGDYAAAKLNAQSNYTSDFNAITNSYYLSEANDIANGLIDLIDSHMQDVFLVENGNHLIKVGDKYYLDKNGDGVIDDQDKTPTSVDGWYFNIASRNSDPREWTSDENPIFGRRITEQDVIGSNWAFWDGEDWGGAITATLNYPVEMRFSWAGDDYHVGMAVYNNNSRINCYRKNVSSDSWGCSKSIPPSYPFGSRTGYDSSSNSLTATGNYFIMFYRDGGHGVDGRDYVRVDFETTNPNPPFKWAIPKNPKYCPAGYTDNGNHLCYKDGGIPDDDIAKRLDVTTDNMVELENNWLRENHYKDYSFVSNTIWKADSRGFNSVRFNLSTNINNGITKGTNNYIRPLIKDYITNLVRNYYTKKITYEFDNHITGDTILDNYTSKKLSQLFNDAISDSNNQGFKPFNKIKIYDLFSDSDSQYAINYEIDTPSGLLVKSPDALNIVMLSFPEVRRYRCYTDFDKCNLSINDNNCTLNSTLDYNFIKDYSGKKVATLRKETYKCTKETIKTTCNKYEVKKKCYNMDINNSSVEFEDSDFSQYFAKTVGQNLALNESISLFNGQLYRCEKGYFIDFMSVMNELSNLSSPTSLVSQSLNLLGNQTSATVKAFKGFFSGGVTSTDHCAEYWLQCMKDHNSTVQNIISGGASYASYCDTQTLNQSGCESFEGVSHLAEKLNQQNDNQFAEQSQDAFSAYVTDTVYNIISLFADNCNQCIDKQCASAHKPTTAIRLYKMTSGKQTFITGAKYGLGPDFIAYNQCFYKDVGCAKRLLGKCLRKKEEYCCYNTKMARILAGQMYQQLGLTYKVDGCDALKVTDLLKISFAPCADNTIPSPSNKCINYKELEDYINSKINWNVKGSFDMNKAIQAIMDEGN